VRSSLIKSLGILVILLSICGSLPAQAVSGKPCESDFVCGVYSLYDARCIPYPPATVYDCVTIGPFTAQCKVRNNGCAPPSRCKSCNTASSPIDLADGNTFITQSDIRIPGLGGGLNLVRTWNSIWPSTHTSFGSGSSEASGSSSVGSPPGSTEENISALGLFGPNWRSTYEERIYVDSDQYLTYSRGDGTFWSFGWASNNNNTNIYTVVGPANQTATLSQGDTSWTLVFLNGEKRTFDRTSGDLTSIVDRNGNTTQITYDLAFRVKTVTDPAGRHLYFSYQNDSSYLITSVTSDVGISLTYTYDSQKRLIQVTKQDNTSVYYEYDGLMITAVKDNDGKIIESHTYDSAGKGLTASRANGVGAVTVTYPQPPEYKLAN
jgi:YD repeat-containing protein